MRDCLKSIWSQWDQFWFSSRDVTPIALFRSVFYFIAFCMYSIRLVDIKVLYFESGLMPSQLAKEFLPEFWRPLFFWYPTTDTMALILHILFVIILFLLAIGIKGRWLAIIAWILHLSFMQRNYTVIYGADIINCFWFFFLCFVDPKKQMSLFYWLKNGRRAMESSSSVSTDILTSVGWRLIQIQLCITYGYTGLEKLKGDKWWDGSAVWDIMGHDFLATIDFSFMHNFPFIIVLMTYMTLIFEIYFIAVIWNRKIRPYWLFIGLLMHSGIGLFMGLHFFAVMMVSVYIVFISPETLRQWLEKFQTKLKIVNS